MRLPCDLQSAAAALLLFTSPALARRIPDDVIEGDNVDDRETPVRQVAIIGAGAAGSSAAYHLRKYAEQYNVNVNITIFEKTNHIGGRTLTINPYDDPSLRLELGASIFIEKNYILNQSVEDFGLRKKDPDVGSDPKMGIWDGEKFVFEIDTSSSWISQLWHIVWKYGIRTPKRTNDLVQETVFKFLRMYEEPYFPFKSLTQRAYDLDLASATGATGEEFLKANNIYGAYAHDIVQASTRVNYATNIGRLHGLDTMVAMAPAGATAVQGGNWQIFQKMVERSGATIMLNTSVSSISFAKTGSEATTSAKYSLRAIHSSSQEDTSYPVEFDNVILANPYQFSNINIADGVLETHIDEIPYVRLHVTIFTSPFRYSPGFFGLENPKALPGTVLTTLGKTDNATSGVAGAGSAGFFSISMLRKLVNPKTQKEEYAYKIFSPEKVTPEFLSRLFGVKVPETFIAEPNDQSSAEVSPISWYYPHVFYSYPKAEPRVTFQDPIVGAGFYYTSGMESFISTMETNALMGKNVARLIVDDMRGVESGGVQSHDGSLAPGQQLKMTCDRAGRGAGKGGVRKAGEVPKTRPTELPEMPLVDL
ncbi:Prenylcysteine lyase-domain-containing protein [Neurospora crassa]|nr:Prenylcysteine lyase-domain-containing protein [Neurospora crassa]